MRLSSLQSPRGFLAFLRSHGLKFACAESCTGGQLSRRLTKLPGSSEVFWGGVVSYANEAKTSLLGVSPDLIRAEGAVSGEVARAMVEGLVTRSGVPLAAAVTGVAGPTGGSPEKPVGTVWLGLSAQRGDLRSSVAVRVFLAGSRAAIQRQSAQWATVLAALWWDSGMELDSVRSLTDNTGKAVVDAFLPPLSFPPTL